MAVTGISASNVTFRPLGLHVTIGVRRNLGRGARRSGFLRRLLLVGGFGRSGHRLPGFFGRFDWVGFRGWCYLRRWGVLLRCRSAGRLIGLDGVLCRHSAGTQQQYRCRGGYLVVDFSWMSPVDTPQLFDFVDVWRDNVGQSQIVPTFQ